MTELQNDLQMSRWVNSFEEMDREISRLCLLCQVRILDHGIIERVLKRDETVCGTSNPVAFEKLHNMLMFYFANRQKSVDAVGQLQTAQIEAHVVERLRNHFGDLLGKWPPA